MARNDDMKLYEPEGFDPEERLDGDAAAHRDLHRALIAAGLEWKKKDRVRLSEDFNERLLERLEREGTSSARVDDRDFAPVAGAGESPFFNRRGFLAATAAIFFVTFGIFWFQAYSDLQKKEMAPLLEQTPGKGESDGVKTPATRGKELPRVVQPHLKEAEDGLPARSRQPARERSADLRVSAPSAPGPESQAEKRSAWGEEPTLDRETTLREQIAAETNPARRKELLQQLLRLYEAEGQSQKAAQVRRQIQGL